jgi:hypothetical protein
VDSLAIVIAEAPTPAQDAAMLDEFDRWLPRSVRTPGASFEVLEAGSDRNSATARFSAVIPRSWGAPNAAAHRERFCTEARQRLQRAFLRQGTAVAAVPLSTGEASPRLMTLPELDSRGMRWTWNAPSAPVHEAVICDVSPSAAGRSCTDASLLHAYDGWAGRALTTGSTLHIWVVGRSISTASCMLAVETPDLSLAGRAAYLLGARHEVAAALRAGPPCAGSAVAETIAVAVADLASRAGAKDLRVLSDLRQTSGPWSFDRRVPTAPEFLRWLAAEHLLPDCTGISVAVCGLHFHDTPTFPAFSARQGDQVRRVWELAFAAMHARVRTVCSACDAAAFFDEAR